MERFATVVLDVDSTLCSIEGIDWLAKRRGPDVSARVMDLTDRAMRGEIGLDAVYGERLALVQPDRSSVEALGAAYGSSLAPGAVRAIQLLRDAGRRVVLVSGGVLEAIRPVAQLAGVADDDVHAVSVHFDTNGAYLGYDSRSPLATSAGKRTVVESLVLPARRLGVGDGATDLAMRPAVDAFAVFTGFVRRESVVAAADHVLESFDQLVELVLG